jgi:hypothetical protein
MPKLKAGRMYVYVGDFSGSLGVMARVPGFRSKFFGYAKHGIRLSRTIVRAGKRYKTVRWVAQWQEGPQVNRKREFSVKKYGEDGAKQLAIEHRKKMVSKILGE